MVVNVNEVVAVMFVILIATMFVARNVSTSAKSNQNLFSSLTSKYQSLIPGLTAKYGAFPKPFNWIYSEDDFSRIDEHDDFEFYQNERLVYHIDENARNSLTDFYAMAMNAELSRLSAPSINVLDICSSWVSHFPQDLLDENKIIAKGIGMTEIELAKNEAFKSKKDYFVQNLNVNPVINAELAPNDFFDFVTIAVSIDYLIHPKEVIHQILRTLKPNGILILSWSNRMFWSKAIKIWTDASESERVFIAASFLFYYFDDGTHKNMNLRFDTIDAFRIDDESKQGDPMYVVIARKKADFCEEDNSKINLKSHFKAGD